MDCDWDSLLAVLPEWMRGEMDAFARASVQEVRLRLGQPPEIVFGDKFWSLPGKTNRSDLDFCINAASHYSPWSVESSAQGYIALPGGHRMGLCGEVIWREQRSAGFRTLDSLCIRVARDIRGLAPEDCGCLGSILILGAPGWGKTTLLRCIARQLAGEREVCVVDERQELFPRGFQRGHRMDVLSGCGKGAGIQMVLRCLGPDYIAVDEVTQEADALALAGAAGCGVKLLATAHASSMEDLRTRPCYRPLLEQGMFQTVLLLKKDKSFRRERMEKWVTNG